MNRKNSSQFYHLKKYSIFFLYIYSCIQFISCFLSNKSIFKNYLFINIIIFKKYFVIYIYNKMKEEEEKNEINTKDIIFKPKIILLGDDSVGKSTFIKRLNFPNTTSKFYKRLGCVITTVPIETSFGTIECNFWDTCGQERFGILRDAFFIEADFTLMFFDITNRDSYIHCARWYSFLQNFVQLIDGKMRFILVGNKLDQLANREVGYKQIQFPRRIEVPYIEVSLLSNYNVDRLLLLLCRRLLLEPELTIKQEISLADPEIPPDLDAYRESDARLEEAFKEQLHVPPTNSGIWNSNTPRPEFEEDLIRDLEAGKQNQ